MGELSTQKVGRKNGWALNPRAFEHLLRWLDGGQDSGGEKYLEARRRLVAYFDRKNCPAPDDLADETLNRVARRLEEEGTIESESPAKYCYIVARFVLMEHRRDALKTQRAIEEMRVSSAGNDRGETRNGWTEESMLSCLERCAGRLQPRDRDTIVRYYVGSGRAKIENRRALAGSLGISLNALSIRACRLRDLLHDCVRRCLGVR